jgi:hypothetical protein
MNQRKANKHTNNRLIAVLSIAMGRLNIEGRFTVQDGAWVLWRDGLSYPLAGLRNVAVTADNHILLDLPGRTVILREEAMA